MASSGDQYDRRASIPSWITPELLADTRRVWQPYYEKELTQDDLLGLLLPIGVLYELLSSKGDENEQTKDEGEYDEELHRARSR